MSTTPEDTEFDINAVCVTPGRYLNWSELGSSPVFDNDTISQVRTSLKRIVQSLHINFRTWQLAQKNGMMLCDSMEIIKSRALESVNKSTATNDTGNEYNTAYPPELQIYCDKLAVIISTFADITKKTSASLNRLRSLSKLLGSDEILFQTWQTSKFIEFIEEMETRYTKETEVKRYLIGELANGHTKADLIRSTCAWEYPQYVDDWVVLMFAFLTKEVNVQRRF